MKEIALIYPHQLFARQPTLARCSKAVLIEEPLFFWDQQYRLPHHRLKLMLHRASMKQYHQRLKAKGHQVSYLEWNELKRTEGIVRWLNHRKIDRVHVVRVDDFVLEHRLERALHKAGIELCWYESPLFLTSLGDLEQYFAGKKSYRMTSFYRWQRERLDVLMTRQGKPQGGKLTYDVENRKKMPKDYRVPSLPRVKESPAVQEARLYVRKHFPQAVGSDQELWFPTDIAGARKWLRHFLQHRLEQFGPYQDAFEAEQDVLFHAVLTPMLNCGLLTPQEVLQKTIAFAGKHRVSFSSLEGFIRQVIGWREFMRAMYVREGVTIRNGNYWKHKRKLPESFWTGETGLPPVDQAIKRVLRLGYTHHIERLMVLGNIMVLCEFDPDEVYRWFMSLFVDAYDWVMVPNVYSMSQYADGGLLTTKPYISSSNYLRKMSHFAKGSWCETWDGLYWRFISKHREFFAQNPRMSVMVRQLDKMPADRLKRHLKRANAFIRSLS